MAISEESAFHYAGELGWIKLDNHYYCPKHRKSKGGKKKPAGKRADLKLTFSEQWFEDKAHSSGSIVEEMLQQIQEKARERLANEEQTAHK